MLFPYVIKAEVDILAYRVQKLFLFLVLCFGFACSGAYKDPIAYASGTLVAELVVEGWIAVAHKDRERLDLLITKISDMQEYGHTFNPAFLSGVIDCLQNKDIKTQVKDAQLDELGYALVLSCHYLWLSQLLRFQELQTWNLEMQEGSQLAAIKKAVCEVYGELLPDKIAAVQDELGVLIGAIFSSKLLKSDPSKQTLVYWVKLTPLRKILISVS